MVYSMVMIGMVIRVNRVNVDKRKLMLSSAQFLQRSHARANHE